MDNERGIQVDDDDDGRWGGGRDDFGCCLIDSGYQGRGRWFQG